MNTIQEDHHKRIQEKMKKVHQSTELIKLIEEKRISDFENKKLERYENKYENKLKINSDKEDKKFKEKRRFEDVRDKFLEIQKKLDRRNKELSNKLKKKSYNRLSNQNIEHYFLSRQNSSERFSLNSSNIKKESAMKNMRYLKIQSERNIRSHDKIKTLDLSKDNVRYLLIFFLILNEEKIP